MRRGWLIVGLLVLPLATLGGREAWAAWTLAGCAAACALALRPSVAGALERTLLVIAALLLVQILPLPQAILDLVSPHARPTHDALALTPEAAAGRTLSVSPGATAWALAVWFAALALFLAARQQFATGGLRHTARSIAALGLVVSLLAIAQAATADRHIFWLFPTPFEGPQPFGPFVNRNHFATWAIMVFPLTAGYLAAHAHAHQAHAADVAHRRSRIARAVDPRAAWLALAAAVVLLALLLSLSRAGVLALGTSALLTWGRMRGALGERERRGAAALAAALTIFALAWSDLPAFAERLAGAGTDMAGRLTIWRETVPIVRDFPFTGTGAGTFQLAMFVYQRADRTVYFNQAHNHYLQIAAEGGLLLVVPACLAIGLFVRTASASIAGDRSPTRWIRVGAACGLGAAAVQSLFETGLVMPANAALAAVLAAAIVHRHER